MACDDFVSQSCQPTLSQKRRTSGARRAQSSKRIPVPVKTSKRSSVTNYAGASWLPHRAIGLLDHRIMNVTGRSMTGFDGGIVPILQRPGARGPARIRARPQKLKRRFADLARVSQILHGNHGLVQVHFARKRTKNRIKCAVNTDLAYVTSKHHTF
jgi:hypothetical protein